MERKKLRKRKRLQSTTPREWPNGSGLYREGTAHLKTDEGLLGRSFRSGDKVKAWRYVGKGTYQYLGVFDSSLKARNAITGGK